MIIVTDDTGMFYGMKFFNDYLMEAGPYGNVQTELLMEKDKAAFTLRQGWGFPRRVYFNGEECMLPQPDQYPSLPNSGPRLAWSRSFSKALAGPLLMMFLWTL